MQDYRDDTDCHNPLRGSPRAPPGLPQDAMEASLTRKEIRQGEEAQLQVDSPIASRKRYSHIA